MNSSSSWEMQLVETAKEELEILQSQYPNRFAYLKSDLQSFISHLREDHAPPRLSPSSSVVLTQGTLIFMDWWWNYRLKFFLLVLFYIFKIVLFLKLFFLKNIVFLCQIITFHILIIGCVDWVSNCQNSVDFDITS